MGLPDPYDVAAYDALRAEVCVGPPEVLSGRLIVCDYDPVCPDMYRLATREWKYVQQHADAKTGVVGEIMRRAVTSTSA